MYQLTLTQSEWKKLRTLAKCKMYELELTQKDIADMTGYTVSSIQQFFHENSSRFVAFAIAKSLDIDIEEIRKGSK